MAGRAPHARTGLRPGALLPGFGRCAQPAREAVALGARSGMPTCASRRWSTTGARTCSAPAETPAPWPHAWKRPSPRRQRMTAWPPRAPARWPPSRCSTTSPTLPQRELERVVRRWWQGTIVPGWPADARAIARDDAYRPLRNSARHARQHHARSARGRRRAISGIFRIEHLVSYYPAPLPGRRRRLLSRRRAPPGEPDLRQAALSRAAELAMVAYDVNSSGQPDAARLAHAGPLHSAQRFRRAV